MPKAVPTIPPLRVDRDRYNPYAHAARIRREALKLIASGECAPADPFANVGDEREPWEGVPQMPDPMPKGGAA